MTDQTAPAPLTDDQLRAYRKCLSDAMDEARAELTAMLKETRGTAEARAAGRVETTTHAGPEPHGLAAIRDRVKRDHILTEAEIDGASSGWIELMQARRDRAELLAALDTKLDEQPDVDGWTIYPAFDGGVMVSHDTDADRPTLGALDSIPLAAALAFIADADEDEEAPEPAEPTLRDVMAAAHRAHLSIRRAWDEPGDTEHATAWEIRNWDGDLVGAVHRVRYISDGVRISYGEGPHWTVTLLHGPLYDDADLATLADADPDRVDVPDPAPGDILTAARLAGLIGDTDGK